LILIHHTTYKEWSLTNNFNKTEFIAFNADQTFNIDIEENDKIKQSSKV
jgi:hypothetical protein